VSDPDQILKPVKHCLSAWDLRIHKITMAAQSDNIVYHLISEATSNFVLVPYCQSGR
jgi:hypothetical protein